MSETQTTESIAANFDKNVDVKDFKFRFKKDGLGNQRPSVELKAGIPSVEGFIAILQAGGKQLELLQEAAYGIVRAELTAYVQDNENAAQDTIDWSKFTWEAIANKPAQDRRSSAISAEAWDDFAKEYITIMPGITGKSPEAVGNAVLVYRKKFAQIKTDKVSLAKLKDQLALFTEHTKNGEAHQEILELLLNKVDTYLKSDDVAQLVANL